MSTAPHAPPAASGVPPTTAAPATPTAAGALAAGATTPDDMAQGMLRGLDGLDDLPVADHVALYEAAHDRMRTALTTPPGPAS